MERREFIKKIGKTIGVAGALIFLEGCSIPSEHKVVEKKETKEGTAGFGLQEVEITAQEFSFKPSTILLKVGRPIELTIVNAGLVDHDLKSAIPIKDLIYREADNDPDEEKENSQGGVFDVDYEVGHTSQVIFTPTSVGNFPFYCDVEGHKDAGMRGMFVVKPDS